MVDNVDNTAATTPVAPVAPTVTIETRVAAIEAALIAGAKVDPELVTVRDIVSRLAIIEPLLENVYTTFLGSTALEDIKKRLGF